MFENWQNGVGDYGPLQKAAETQFNEAFARLKVDTFIGGESVLFFFGVCTSALPTASISDFAEGISVGLALANNALCLTLYNLLKIIFNDDEEKIA